MAIGKLEKLNPASGGFSDAAEKTVRAREDKLNFADPYVEKKQPRNQKVDEVAKMYEKQFLGEMMKAMRGTVSESEFTKPSMAEKVYKDQMDERYVDQWGENGGIGLSNMIYDQIMNKYFAQGEGPAHGAKMASPQNPGGHSTSGSASDTTDPLTGMMKLRNQGTLKLSDRDVLKVSRMTAERPNQIPMKVELGPSNQPGHVQAPWDGTVITQARLPDGKSAITLDHGVGLRSTLIFDGVAGVLKPGQKVAKGDSLGTLSPESHSFFWNLNQPAL